MEKIYKSSELPHLNIPAIIRRYIRNCLRENNTKLTEVRYRLPNNNYNRKTIIITEKMIIDLCKSVTTEAKKRNCKNALAYMKLDYDSVIIEKKVHLPIKEQSLRIGKSKDYIACIKSQNTKIYRLMRFVGRGNYVKAYEKLNDEFYNMIYAIDEKIEDFKYKNDFIKFIVEKSSDKSIQFIPNTHHKLNKLLCSSFSFEQYKKAKWIYRNLQK